MCQILSLFLFFCLFVGQVCVDECVILCLVDQKGNMCVQLEVVGVLDDLIYDICWFEFFVVVFFVEVFNVGVVDVGIIGDVLLFFVLVVGVWLKVIVVDKFDFYGIVVLVRGDLLLCLVNDLKGQCIVIGCGFIGYFVVFKVLVLVGLGEKDVEFCFFGLVDVKMVFVNGFVDVWVIWEFYIVFVEIVDKVWVLVDGCGLWVGNSFFVVIDSVLVDLVKCVVLQDYL